MTTLAHKASFKRSLFELGAATSLDRYIRGWKKSSDHAPTWIELSGASKKRRRKAAR